MASIRQLRTKPCKLSNRLYSASKTCNLNTDFLIARSSTHEQQLQQSPLTFTVRMPNDGTTTWNGRTASCNQPPKIFLLNAKVSVPMASNRQLRTKSCKLSNRLYSASKIVQFEHRPAYCTNVDNQQKYRQSPLTFTVCMSIVGTTAWYGRTALSKKLPLMNRNYTCSSDPPLSPFKKMDTRQHVSAILQ